MAEAYRTSVDSGEAVLMIARPNDIPAVRFTPVGRRDYWVTFSTLVSRVIQPSHISELMVRQM